MLGAVGVESSCGVHGQNMGSTSVFSLLVRITSSLSIAIERTKSVRKPTEKNDVNARGWTSFAYCLKMTAKQPLNTADAAAVR